MSETGFVPSRLTPEAVERQFEKALEQMEFLHLRALINQQADVHFPVDEGWQVEKGEAAMADMAAFRDEMLRAMKGE